VPVESLGLDSGQDAELFWTVVAALAMVAGLLGVVVPVLPGLLLIWGAALVYGLLVGFGTVGWIVITVLTVLAAISVIKGFIIPRRAAVRSGASPWAQFGAFVGGVLGFFLIPVLGVILGALGGLLAVELMLKGNWNDAWTATIGTARGFGVSALIDLGLGTLMIACWSIWAATVVL
jgi:uncharacterized protein YqgC (DUF456 family)